MVRSIARRPGGLSRLLRHAALASLVSATMAAVTPTEPGGTDVVFTAGRNCSFSFERDQTDVSPILRGFDFSGSADSSYCLVEPPDLEERECGSHVGEQPGDGELRLSAVAVRTQREPVTDRSVLRST